MSRMLDTFTGWSSLDAVELHDPVNRMLFGFERRGSLVRTSVFGWRTFPDLCLIYG